MNHPARRPSRPLAALVLAALASAGCSDSEASERLRANALATWESAVEVALEARDDVEEALLERLDQLEPHIEELRVRARSLGAEAGELLERKISELEREHEALRGRLDALQRAGRETWERLAREAQSELEALKGHVREVVEQPPR